MKNQNKERVPLELVEKLKTWATKELSEDESQALNTILGIYYLGVEKRPEILKEYPEFVKEVAAAAEEKVALPFVTTTVTPYTTTTTTLTTIASHPWIGCKKD